VTQFCRGQTTIITSSERNERATSIALFTRHARNFGHARSPCAECTWHDSRRAHTRACARARACIVRGSFRHGHGGDTYPQTQDSVVPLLQMLSNVPLPRPTFPLCHSFAKPSGARGVSSSHPSEPSRFHQETNDRLSGNDRQFPDRRRHAPHDPASIQLDPPVRSIGGILRRQRDDETVVSIARSRSHSHLLARARERSSLLDRRDSRRASRSRIPAAAPSSSRRVLRSGSPFTLNSIIRRVRRRTRERSDRCQVCRLESPGMSSAGRRFNSPDRSTYSRSPSRSSSERSECNARRIPTG